LVAAAAAAQLLLATQNGCAPNQSSAAEPMPTIPDERQIWDPVDRWYFPTRPPNRLWLSGRRGQRGCRTDLKLGPVWVRWAPAIPAPGHVLELRRQGKRQLHFGPWGGNRFSCVPSASVFLHVECRRQIRRPLRWPSDQQRVQVRQVVPLDNSAAFAGLEFVASYFV
jgi:hypothetical protein